MRVLILFLLLQSNEQHHRASVAPISLAEIEAAALQNNPEIRVMRERVTQAKAGIIPATALDDPSFTYQAWGTPLLQPWNLNQTQHMFLYSQTIPGSGKRELRYATASQAVDVVEAELESKKLEVAGQVRAVFFDLLRNNDELRLHDEQIALAEQAVSSARIKYTVGRVP